MSALLTLLSKRRIRYQLGRFFKSSTPDQAAPLPASYTEAGAVGSLTVTDTGNKLSVTGGALVQSTATAASDPKIVGGAIARVAGRTLLLTLTHATTAAFDLVSWNDGGGLYIAGMYIGAATFNPLANGAIVDPVGVFVGATPYELAIVLRGTGAIMLVRGGAFAIWTVLWVDKTSTLTPMYPTWRTITGAVSITLNNLRVADLGGAWATDYGIATNRKATSAGADTITHTANCLVEHTITAATGVTQELWVRRTDASNGWIVRMSQAGSTIKLIEIVAGAETERASTAQTWTNGTQYRVVVICDGTTITPYVANVAKTGYASASTNQTATQGYVSHAGADLVAWPRTVALPSGV